jgi:glyoxylase-like metal-dependent hydrolase (beta-lactamase superfamily II)
VSLTRVSRFGFVNAFLVEEEDGLTLVDTTIGGRGAAKPILAAAAELGRPIVRIALTHAHGDHIGGLDALAAELPGVEVVISVRDARLLARDKSTDPGEPADAKMRGSYPGAKTQATRTLAAGDRVGSLEVIAAPGHTPGQVAFLDTRDRTLLAGDAFSTLGGMATSAKANPRFPFPVMATWHKPTALETARTLRALDPARLAVGHGKIVDAPGAAMDAAIAKAARA